MTFLLVFQNLKMIFLLVVMKNLRKKFDNHDFNRCSVNDEFDRPLSADEVLKAVKK